MCRCGDFAGRARRSKRSHLDYGRHRAIRTTLAKCSSGGASFTLCRWLIQTSGGPSPSHRHSAALPGYQHPHDGASPACRTSHLCGVPAACVTIRPLGIALKETACRRSSCALNMPQGIIILRGISPLLQKWQHRLKPIHHILIKVLPSHHYGNEFQPYSFWSAQVGTHS